MAASALAVVSVLFSVVPRQAGAREIRVPADQPGIQEAIDAAEDGDVIRVSPGTYAVTEPITFGGKRITVRSAAGPGETVITALEPSTAGAIIRFEEGEGPDTVLEGFTVTGARRADNFTHAVQCRGASPTVRGNHITGNRSGVFLGGSDARILENRIYERPGLDARFFAEEDGTYWSSTIHTAGSRVVVRYTGGGPSWGQVIGFENLESSLHVRAVRSLTIRNGDVNGDERIDVTDVVYLLRYLFVDRSGVPVERRGLPVTGQPSGGTSGNPGVPREFEVMRQDPEDPAGWYTVDHTTGLMWQYAGDGVPRSWEEALAYADGLVLGGFDDWRLPNAKELQSLMRYEPCCTFDGHWKPFFDVASYAPQGFDYWEFWSSTTLHGAPLSLDFFSVFLMRASSHPHWARAVRTVQPGDLADPE